MDVDALLSRKLLREDPEDVVVGLARVNRDLQGMKWISFEAGPCLLARRAARTCPSRGRGGGGRTALFLSDASAVRSCRLSTSC